MSATKDIWTLEETAPSGCEAVRDLYSWSLNYDAGKGPMTLYLDLIGWSEDNIGETLYNLGDARQACRGAHCLRRSSTRRPLLRRHAHGGGGA